MSRTTVARASVVLGFVIALIGANAAISSGDNPVPTPAASTGADFVGVTTTDLTENLQALSAHLEEQPQDAQGWALLAEGYVEQARLTSDPSYYSKADEAIQQSLTREPDDNAAAYSAQAALASARHEFSLALESARTSLDINPLDQVALAIRTDALTELGRYGAALQSARLMDRKRPGLAATTRLAYQAELRGKLETASASFARAAENSTGSDLAFALVHQGNLQRLQGKLGSAQELYRRALLARADDPTALAGLARVAVARGDLTTATRRAQEVATISPLPENVTFLGELLLSAGDNAAAQQQFDVAEATARLASSEGVNVDLELALFFADHGDAADALAAAQRSWRERHTVHTADALGWALHSVGDDKAALRFARSAVQLGTNSAQFLHHLGVIEAALGLDRDASRHLTAALEADPGYSPWQQDSIQNALKALGSSS